MDWGSGAWWWNKKVKGRRFLLGNNGEMWGLGILGMMKIRVAESREKVDGFE